MQTVKRLTIVVIGVIEVKKLLAEMEIVHDQGTAGAGPERILIVGDRPALSGGQYGSLALGGLMQFATSATIELLIVDSGRGVFSDR